MVRSNKEKCSKIQILTEPFCKVEKRATSFQQCKTIATCVFVCTWKSNAVIRIAVQAAFCPQPQFWQDLGLVGLGNRLSVNVFQCIGSYKLLNFLHSFYQNSILVRGITLIMGLCKIRQRERMRGVYAKCFGIAWKTTIKEKWTPKMSNFELLVNCDHAFNSKRLFNGFLVVFMGNVRCLFPLSCGNN